MEGIETKVVMNKLSPEAISKRRKASITTDAVSIASDAFSKPSSVRNKTSGSMRLNQQNLQLLQDNTGSLHETDIFKVCVKTL